MESKQFFRNYSICFYLFGVYSRNPFCTSNQCYMKILSCIPLVVHIFCVILFVYSLCRDTLNLDKLSLYYSSGIVAIIPNIVFIFLSIVSAKTFDDILSKLDRANTHLNRSINVQVKFEHLERSIHIKCVFGVILIGVLYLLKVLFHSLVLAISTDFYAFILTVCKCWALHFVILLVDYMNILLFSLNERLEQVRFDEFHLDGGVWDLIHLLRHIRIVHFKLHKVTVIINSQFGWFWITMLLDVFIVINNSFFRSFLMLANSDVPIRNLLYLLF